MCVDYTDLNKHYPKDPFGLPRIDQVINSTVGCDLLCFCRMDLPGPTTLVGTRTDYSVGPWDYSACATRYLMVWGARTTVEKYSDRKLYMSCTMSRTPRRTRLVLSPQTDL
jgi:hypothetical protein